MVVGEVALGAAAAGAGEWAVELVEYEEGAVELGGDEEEGEGEVVAVWWKRWHGVFVSASMIS